MSSYSATYAISSAFCLHFDTDMFSWLVYLSGFAKRYLQVFLATVSFEACSVLDHFFSYYNFSTKDPQQAAVDKEHMCL